MTPNHGSHIAQSCHYHPNFDLCLSANVIVRRLSVSRPRTCNHVDDVRSPWSWGANDASVFKTVFSSWVSVAILYVRPLPSTKSSLLVNHGTRVLCHTDFEPGNQRSLLSSSSLQLGTRLDSLLISRANIVYRSRDSKRSRFGKWYSCSPRTAGR